MRGRAGGVYAGRRLSPSALSERKSCGPSGTAQGACGACGTETRREKRREQRTWDPQTRNGGRPGSTFELCRRASWESWEPWEPWEQDEALPVGRQAGVGWGAVSVRHRLRLLGESARHLSARPVPLSVPPPTRFRATPPRRGPTVRLWGSCTRPVPGGGGGPPVVTHNPLAPPGAAEPFYRPAGEAAAERSPGSHAGGWVN